jgi:hypothetical protein
LPATATNCAPTCGPGPSTPNARPMPTATNSPSYAPGPATTPIPLPLAGAPAHQASPPALTRLALAASATPRIPVRQ